LIAGWLPDVGAEASSLTSTNQRFLAKMEEASFFEYVGVNEASSAPTDHIHIHFFNYINMGDAPGGL
jgi:hypothetical protein